MGLVLKKEMEQSGLWTAGMVAVQENPNKKGGD